MSELITITRALPQLKLLDKRIGKLIAQSRLVDLFQNRKDLVIGGGVTKEVFEKNAKAELQSIEELIERRKKIKSAILLSNAKTKVKIGGIEYAVIEAIERKNSIGYEQRLLEVMRAQLSNVRSQIETNRPKLDKSIDDMVKQSLGSDTKPSAEDYDTISKPLLKANELIIIDPCKLEEKIATMDKDIDEFLTEVDAALSEINSITKIEV